MPRPVGVRFWGGLVGSFAKRRRSAQGLTENPIVYALNVAQLEERELLELTASTVAFLHPADLATFAAWGVASFHCLLEHYPQCVALLQFFLGHSHTSKVSSPREETSTRRLRRGVVEQTASSVLAIKFL